jgi:hypothetical protein
VSGKEIGKVIAKDFAFWLRFSGKEGIAQRNWIKLRCVQAIQTERDGLTEVWTLRKWLQNGPDVEPSITRKTCGTFRNTIRRLQCSPHTPCASAMWFRESDRL